MTALLVRDGGCVVFWEAVLRRVECGADFREDGIFSSLYGS